MEGFRYFNNSTGGTDRAYRVYNGNGGAGVPDFGKANGLGGVTALCKPTPIEIGNRVWRDQNGNGVQDPNESRAAVSPVAMTGVTVRLYDAGGNLIATALTDQDGEYYFSSDAGTSSGNAEHPNIIRVFDTGKMSDSRIYVSMEYLPSGSLEDEARGGFVKLSRAKEVIIDVLRELEHAHSKEIVHRDIKPANILIGKHKEGILSDFGLALPDIKSINLASLKTYQYLLHLAPEIRDFHEQTVLSDIYACGVTLYRLVNGDIYLPKISARDARVLAQRGKFPD